MERRPSLAQFLYGPLLLTERTSVVLFDPETHAALVEAVVTLSPHHHAVLSASGVQLGLRLTPGVTGIISGHSLWPQGLQYLSWVYTAYSNK